MSTESIHQIVARLAAPGSPADAGPLDAARFAARLGAALQPAEDNADWTFYTFELPGGPFGGGELRLSRAGHAALLILTPREPLSLTPADVQAAAWGPRLSVMPNPRIPPEGADTEVYQLDGVTLSAQWLHTSRKLRSLVLEWGTP